MTNAHTFVTREKDCFLAEESNFLIATALKKSNSNYCLPLISTYFFIVASIRIIFVVISLYFSIIFELIHFSH
jgi:hypothetical protein